MKSRSINSKVPQDGLLSRGEESQAPLPLGDLAAKKQARIDAQNAITAAWFDRAVGAYGKGSALAAELGVTEAYVSEMRSGKRTVAFRHLLPLLEHEDSALTLIAALCDAAGLAVPGRPRKVSKKEVQEATTRKVRGILQLWQIVRADVAAELDTTVEDAESALDEVTQERAFAK